ncbi:MAG: succinyl-diaminopimelate desuccinylase [Rhodobacteraceae bacterium]|nr:succinyl-diaminopimelate desuccinylase [Paracoccaceae bacterium]
MTVPDPVDLTAALIRCPSVTPEEGGAIALLQDVLTGVGFESNRVDRGGISNLLARWGPKGHPKTFGFNGHIDVVPVGNADAWSVPPFGAMTRDGILYGRGATDMKSGVAGFVSAAVDVATRVQPDGAILMTITGDEEGDALHGTKALLDQITEVGEKMSVCLVGEPTCSEHMGDMIKVGRRGSMTAYFTATGIQGHSAYPHRARNPVPAIAQLMDRLSSHQLDTGTDHFDPSTLAVVAIDTNSPANNVIPATCTATVNIRFNDKHSGATLADWLRAETDKVADSFGVTICMQVKISGESFLTPPGPLSDLVARAVYAETGIHPVLSTTGGISDARFIKSHCPVVEFGLVGKTMHQVDEYVLIEQVRQLTKIYIRILESYFE